MAINLLRTCDAVKGGAPCGRDAVTSAEARIGETRFRMDLCPECRDDVSIALIELGFAPTKAIVGHSKRGAYVTASGKTFTAKEARAWLLAVGEDVAPVGKLTNGQLDMYAASH